MSPINPVKYCPGLDNWSEAAAHSRSRVIQKLNQGWKMTTELTQEKPAPDAVELRPKVIELQKILVPIDFSDHSRKAFAYALKFAEQFGSELELVNVVTPVIYAEGMVLPAAMENLDQQTEEHAKKELDKMADEAPKVNVRTAVLTGNPYDEIVTHARKQKTDLLLITTHGRTGLQHFLLGSTAEKILRHAPCPVMVVRDKEHEFV